MLRAMIVAVALCLSAFPAWASPPQSADDIAAREAAIRQLFIPAFKAGMRPPLERSWEHFPAADLHPEELVASRSAHATEIEGALESFSVRVTSIIARHVPLDQLQADTDMTTPAWQTAMTEVQSLIARDAEREGFEVAVRVIEVGCKVRAQPSAACLGLLRAAASYRAGTLDPASRPPA